MAEPTKVSRRSFIKLAGGVVVVVAAGGVAYYYLSTNNRSQPPTTPTSTSSTSSQSSSIQLKNPDTFIAALSDQPTELDPAHSHTNYDYPVFLNCMETLVTYDFPHNDLSTIVPLLAEEVPTVANGGISSDGLHYTFKLRQGVKFHNGDPLTSDDVVYTFQRLATLAFPDGLGWIVLQPLTGMSTDATVIQNSVVAVDAYTVEFNLANTDPAFLRKLAPNSVGAYIMDKKWVVDNGGWYPGAPGSWTAKVNQYVHTHVMGTGPYQFVEWVADESVSMKANPNYWGTPASIPNIIHQDVPDQSTRIASLKVGDADYADVAVTQLDTIKGLPGVTYISGSLQLNSYGIAMNQNIKMSAQPTTTHGITADWFTDINLRKAFAYAMDVDTLNHAAYNGLARRLNTYMPQGIPGWD